MLSADELMLVCYEGCTNMVIKIIAAKDQHARSVIGHVSILTLALSPMPCCAHVLKESSAELGTVGSVRSVTWHPAERMPLSRT